MNSVNRGRSGFALPTVLVASIVLLMVLTVSITSVVTIRSSLKTQYYEQLAKTAGEAGVEFAKACLAQNNNVPLWTNANPLRPGTSCNGTYAPGVCPSTSDDRCWVMLSAGMRTGFSVDRPSLDGEGRAVAIPNAGYAELLRASNGAVWRKYTQPSVQAAVVPALCAGATKSSLGWRNASYSSTSVSVTGAPSARAISESSGVSYAGDTYFRKDFNINEAGSYALNFRTSSSSAAARVYVDGVLSQTATSGGTASSITLNPGCHTITVVFTADMLGSQNLAFAGAIKAPGAPAAAAPLFITDATWRVSSGDVVHYSEPDYVMAPSAWSVVRDVSTTSADWASRSGDAFTRIVSTTHNNSSGNYPASRYAAFRAPEPMILSAATEVRLTSNCDDNCVVYMNGEVIGTGGATNSIVRTLPAGRYQVAIRVFNGGSAANPSSAVFAAVRTSDSVTLQRTDNRWMATTGWYAVSPGNPLPTDTAYSYASSFRPSPNQVVDPVAVDVLVVAGGGGGSNNAAGGGGGGGVRIIEGIPIASTGARTVVVGAGGGGAGANVVGARGANSYFISTTYQSVGGGGGAPRSASLILPTSGGAGGGGAGAITANSAGAAGTAGHGGVGGNGTAPDQGCNARGGGGGGAGGAGSPAVAAGNGGDGGPGVITYFMGVLQGYGGGGNGVGTCSVAAGIATNGGGSGSGVSGVAGTGGGGSGQHATAVGGSGGLGTVVIRYKTGTITATGGTISAVGDYTYHRFTTAGSSTFNVTAISTGGVPLPYSGLSVTYSAGSRIVIGAPVTDTGQPAHFGGRDYDLWACHGATNCNPIDMLKDSSLPGTLSWVANAPGGTFTVAPPATGRVVRYQLVAYGNDVVNFTDVLTSNVAPVTIP